VSPSKTDTKKSKKKKKVEVEVENDEESKEYVPKKKKKVVINVYCTDYEVVKKVAKKVCNYRLKEIEEDHEGGVYKGVGAGKLRADWDVSWHDLAISPDYVAKMQLY
jgi:hypothetical protein